MTQACRNFMSNRCRFGDRCKFFHDPNVAIEREKNNQLYFSRYKQEQKDYELKREMERVYSEAKLEWEKKSKDYRLRVDIHQKMDEKQIQRRTCYIPIPYCCKDSFNQWGVLENTAFLNSDERINLDFDETITLAVIESNPAIGYFTLLQ